MKKSSFTALILGTVSSMLFALGMCMALIPEWDAFAPGVVFGSLGVVMGIVTLLIWRKMTHKAPIRISPKALLATAVGVIGALMLGVGMCFCMVWSKMVIGVIIGIIGIAALMALIPIIKGLED